jgi:hypothetical protein
VVPFSIAVSSQVFTSGGRDLGPDAILPFHIQHVLPNDAQECLTLRYDAATSLETGLTELQINTQVPFQNVVITDIDGRASGATK